MKTIFLVLNHTLKTKQQFELHLKCFFQHIYIGFKHIDIKTKYLKCKKRLIKENKTFFYKPWLFAVFFPSFFEKSYGWKSLGYF